MELLFGTFRYEETTDYRHKYGCHEGTACKLVGTVYLDKWEVPNPVDTIRVIAHVTDESKRLHRIRETRRPR